MKVEEGFELNKVLIHRLIFFAHDLEKHNYHRLVNHFKKDLSWYYIEFRSHLGTFKENITDAINGCLSINSSEYKLESLEAIQSVRFISIGPGIIALTALTLDNGKEIQTEIHFDEWDYLIYNPEFGR